MTTQTHEEALAELAELESLLHAAKTTVRQRKEGERLAKHHYAQAYAAWLHDGAPMTQSELLRQHANAETEKRRQRVEQGLPATRAQANRGRSYQDRMRAAMSGGDGADWARKHHQTGNLRGSLPPSMRGRTISPEHAAAIRKGAGMADARPFTPTPKENAR
jgi:hypothetical protein